MTLFALYLSGLVFLLAEAFLIPGFGVAGLAGLGLLGAHVYMVFQTFGAVAAWGVLGAETVLAVGAGTVAAKVLPHTALGRAMIQGATLKGAHAPLPAALDTDLYVGREGVTSTAMRPSGEVRIDDNDYPAKSRGPMIKARTRVRVVKVDGSTLVVEPVTEDADAPEDT